MSENVLPPKTRVAGSLLYSHFDSLVSDKSGSQGTGTGSAVFRIHITYIYSLIPQTHRFVFGLAILEDRPKRDS